MSLDTFLFVVAAILPLLMAALGGHLASEKPGYRIAFWSLGFVTAVIVVFIGVRNERSQAALQRQLNAIQTNTEKQPNITVQPTPVTIKPSVQPKRAYMAFQEPQILHDIGKPMSVNIACQTISDVPAQKVACAGQYFISPLTPSKDVSVITQDQSWKTYMKSRKLLPYAERLTVTKEEHSFATSVGPIYTNNEDTVLSNQTYAVLVVGEMFFRDEAGEHKSEFCRWLQSPLNSNPPRIWRPCHKHDGIVY